MRNYNKWLINNALAISAIILTLILHICDKRSDRPDFDVRYDFSVVDYLDYDIYFDLTKSVENNPKMDIFNSIINISHSGVKDWFYNYLWLDIDLINQASLPASISNIEIRNLKIENEQYDIVTDENYASIYILDEEIKLSTTPINIDISNTFKLIISTPLFFSFSDYLKIDSISTKRIKNKRYKSVINFIAKYNSGESEFIIHKTLYESIIEKSTFSFRLVFTDNRGNKHSSEKIVIDSKNIEQAKLRVSFSG